MNRKDFLKLITTASVGTPFLLNGMSTNFSNDFTSSLIDCSNVNDRVLVIVRLAGGNDGLNTVIPISQYGSYAALRPDIRIQNSGINKYIDLDNTLSGNQLSGLHPGMTGFKSLYDNGKLSIMNGVGYPTPNFSHFKSENTLFAGRDGTNNNKLLSGIFGRYLNALNPNLAGQPTVAKPDPLSIQLGNFNQSLFFGHNHENGIEYNITNFQNDFFNNLSRTLPSNSEHQELLSYITQVEGAMDIYYNRVNDTFNAGNNSSVTYPNSSLGKQLKTVARLVKGGSKTKIFQVNVGGFDTHANQVQSGASHIGAHNNLMSDLSGAITAFQNDIENLGIDDKIMTVTFSEFGRQVRQNSNFGTDHGTLSPFFVIGSNIKAGVYGDHPVFTNTTNFQYNENQRRFDYRQIYATIMQDWLGANDSLMQESELNEFTTADKKIPLIKDSVNAYPTCLIGPADCEDTITAVKVLDDSGWSYYAETGSTNYLFAIEHIPSSTGANTNSFEAIVTLKKQCGVYPLNMYRKINTSKGEGIFAKGYYWNIVLSSGSTNGWVNLRWFNDSTLENNMYTKSQEFHTDSESSYISPKLHLITSVPMELPAQLIDTGLNVAFSSLLNRVEGSYLSKAYTQYNQIDNINNSGGGIFMKITNLDESNTGGTSSAPEAGTIRFNPATSKIEGFDGSVWSPFN